VNRPVASVIDGRIVRGRYLDQTPDDPLAAVPARDPVSGADYLEAEVGAAFADRRMRSYLEKIDGVPLEEVPASRIEGLHVRQSAPDGFWFTRRGIGQLMNAMAQAFAEAGGTLLNGTRVEAISVSGGRMAGVRMGNGALREIAAERLVVAVPPLLAAGLVSPAAPAGAVPAVPMRAVCLVYLALQRDRLTDEAWIQVDDPQVPFARLAEMRNWSADMAPPGRTVLCAECYCRAEPSDRVWSLDDQALGAACAEALASPLGLLDDPAAARTLEVVRLPRAYPSVTVAQVPAAQAPWRFLMSIGGVEVAQGGAVVEAFDAGEAAALRLL
jgi:hypothetical protein